MSNIKQKTWCFFWNAPTKKIIGMYKTTNIFKQHRVFGSHTWYRKHEVIENELLLAYLNEKNK